MVDRYMFWFMKAKKGGVILEPFLIMILGGCKYFFEYLRESKNIYEKYFGVLIRDVLSIHEKTELENIMLLSL